ncbi:MAG: pyrimidine 5'-nucleotidase [Paracoccus sp. (in: a-proteobacteria)]
MDFTDVSVWIFDLDNTLYHPSAALFAQIERRMTDYVARELGMTPDQAARLRDDYWRRHGTTLAGLMTEHGIEPGPYLAEVHDIDMTVLRPDPALARAIRALPGRKIIHTNADSAYAGRVLQRRGLNLFDAVWGVEEVGFHPKPDPRAYACVIEAEAIDPARAAFFEDDPRNLLVPHDLGMRTVLVGSGRHGPDPLPDDHDHGPHVQHRTDDLAAFLRRVG